MSSLFNYLGYRYQRNPHRMAKYLGANQWEILNTLYTGSVTTVGGGKPTVGREYPAFCADPDSWRGWAVLVRRESRVLRRDAAPYWVCFGAAGSRMFCLSPARSATAESEVALIAESVLIVRCGPRGLLLWDGSKIVQGELEIDIEEVVEIYDNLWLTIETITAGYIADQDGDLVELNPGVPESAGPTPYDYTASTHPGRYCLSGGGVGEA